MKKILLIEDDPFLVDIYKIKLKEAGFSVDVATDGEEGLSKTIEGKPDLIILDIVLPIIDGWEFLEKMKQNKIKDVKIVILSNLGQSKEVEKGLKLGAIKYLIKSNHNPSEVVEEIKKTLK